MVNQLELQGRWNEVKGQIQRRWGQLTDEDLRGLEGKADELVGTIQRKTGEARDKIENYLEELVVEGSSAFRRASESARQYATDAAGRFQEQYENVAEGIRSGYEEAAEMVRKRPAESAAVVFGAGLIVGVVLGMMMRSR
jgi:uncharacterized protein YjbJ (UPF0337 family)